MLCMQDDPEMTVCQMLGHKYRHGLTCLRCGHKDTREYYYAVMNPDAYKWLKNFKRNRLMETLRKYNHFEL